MWRVPIWGLALLVLLPASLWYMVGAVAVLPDDMGASLAPPIPLIPAAVSGTIAILVGAWGLVALWWLVIKHESLSFGRVGWIWSGGLIAGTALAVFALVRTVWLPGSDDIVFVPVLTGLLVLEVLLILRIWTRRRRELA